MDMLAGREPADGLTEVFTMVGSSSNNAVGLFIAETVFSCGAISAGMGEVNVGAVSSLE